MKKTLIFCGLLMLFSCGGSSDNSGHAELEFGSAMPVPEMKPDAAGEEVGSAIPDPSNTNVSKKIIKTAQVYMEVEDLKDARSEVSRLVAYYNAQIMEENEQNNSYNRNATLTIKVNPARLDSMLNDIVGIAINLREKTISAEDVTKKYIDLETRLSTKRDVIARYRALLQKAANVGEILAVEEKLRLVIEEVESIENQLKYLRDQTRHSTIWLSMTERLERPAYDKRSFGDKIVSAVKSGWQVFLNLIIGLVSIWPVVIVLVLFFWWVMRLVRKRRSNDD